MAAMKDAVKSLEGNAAHTPFNPKKRGRAASRGRRNNNWRERDKKILIFTLPIHWKKLVTTI